MSLRGCFRLWGGICLGSRGEREQRDRGEKPSCPSAPPLFDLSYNKLMTLDKNLAGLPIDHLGIAVTNLDEASAPYTLIGLPQLGDDEMIASQLVRVRALQAGDSLIELLEPTNPESPIAKFIEKRGVGLHHVALRVTDLEAEVARLKAKDALFINEEPRPGRAGTRVVFLHPKWAKGVLVELVEHA